MSNKQTRIPKGFEHIAELAGAYFAAHEDLRGWVDETRERQRRAGRRRLPGLKRRIAATSAARDALRTGIEDNPHLWNKPRTRALHGVKVGMRALPGKLDIDAEAAPELIRKRLPSRYKTLVKVEYKLQANAIKALRPAELERIGGRIVDLDDEVVIAIPKDATDRLVEALLEDLEEAAP